MRLALLPLLCAPLLLARCGSGQDLVIGELVLPSTGATANAAGTSAGSGAVAGAAAAQGGGGASAAAAGSAAGGVGEAGAGGEAGQAGAAGAPGETDEDCLDGEEPPLGSLIHRYSFDGTGAIAIDSSSGADGQLVGATLDGNGMVTMSGASRQYVDLPNGIVSSLTDMTVVTWMTWYGGAAYQRVFDFGVSSSGEAPGGMGRSYVAVMPMTGFEDQAKPGLGAELRAPGFGTTKLGSTVDMKNRGAQVGFVFQGGQRAALYLDGTLLAAEPIAFELSDIDDRNNWLGQSQLATDPFYQGGYEELRIYDAALNRCQLHTLLVRGPQTP